MSKQIEKKSLNHYFHKIALYAIFTLLIILFSSVIFFIQNDKEDRLIVLGDRVVENFRLGLDYEMVDLLSFSMALSEDGELKNALNLLDFHQANLMHFSILHLLTMP